MGRSIRNSSHPVWAIRIFRVDFRVVHNYNFSVGELALLINVHQPVAQDEATLRRVAQYCYLPLIKLIKNNKNHKFTFNIPLSLLEQMEKYGFDSWINDIKELVNLGAIEVVGSGAYHPLLTHLPKSIAQNQIILNEYGLGYYLGRKTGFEGEKAIMINNLVGFYPPELAVNNDLLEILEELGYKWVLIDEFGSKEDDKFGVFSFSGGELYVVVRNNALSTQLSQIKGTNPSEFMQLFDQIGGGVVSIDAEYFGYRNEDGLYLLNKLLGALEERNTKLISVGDYVDTHISESLTNDIDGVNKSSLGMNDKSSKPYLLWDDTLGTIRKNYLAI